MSFSIFSNLLSNIAIKPRLHRNGKSASMRLGAYSFMHTQEISIPLDFQGVDKFLLMGGGHADKAQSNSRRKLRRVKHGHGSLHEIGIYILSTAGKICPCRFFPS
ncbi:MAG TPA: hypothetical protein VJ577_18905 [Burkholderiaceae bacterium]|nr:hypothetical protein [Burkholderiaceae bacterium]